MLLQRYLSLFMGVIGLSCAWTPAGLRSDDLAQRATKILETHCIKCHNDRDRAGGLSLLSAVHLQKGGDSGSSVEPGDVSASFLIDLITPENGRAEMPQEEAALSEVDIQTLRQWIAEGANWPAGLVLKPPHQVDLSWWSLQPLARPAIPESTNSLTDDEAMKMANPIDAFVLQKLQANGFEFSAPANRRVLARRLYFDLTGLPPTPEDLDLFEQDDHPGAYEKLVDRLLNSPRYGERWARHWLDLVQYADTHGFDKDQPRPNAWPYRDYVIRALNADKPWRQFIQEQIAGDFLFPNTRDGVEALGFIAAGPWDLVGHAEVPESKIDGQLARHLDRDDMVRNAVQSFTSLTIGCAQCHNHKFDPIQQQEYYQLQAVFAALDRADKSVDLNPAIANRRKELLARRAEIEKMTEPSAEDLAEIDHQLQELPPPLVVYAGTVHHGSGNFIGTGHTGGQPRPVRVLYRGEVTQPREIVEPGALSMVSNLSPRFELSENHSESERRAALANWLSHCDNSFTWRSVVNRVWQHHFGMGLVDTPNDFGQMGSQPSHQELLDWLACEFRDGRQSLKDLHRLIVTSRTYRQSSDVSATASGLDPRVAHDPDNRLLWRANRRKLDAESVRDSMLAISGKLDLTMGGPGFREFVMEKPEHSPHYRYELHDFNDASTHRRSIYRFTVRSQLQPFLNALDCADPSQQVARRNESQTPLQALAMMNNGFVLTMAQHFADRLSRDPAFQINDSAKTILARQVERGFLEVTGRLPNDEEQLMLTEYADKYGLANLCRVLFNLNEFLFVD